MSNKKLPIVWTSHIQNDPKKKEEFEQTLRNSTFVLGRLNQILEGKDSSLSNIENNLEEYNSPAWAYKQAHLNGRRAMLKEVRQLLEFTK